MRAVTTGGVGHQLRILYRRSVDRYLVGPGVQEPAHVLDLAHPAAHRERDEYLRRHRLDDMQDHVALIRTRGDVEEGEFVGPLIVVAARDFHRIAGVAQADEIHAFHYAAAGDVKTGNDALG